MSFAVNPVQSGTAPTISRGAPRSFGSWAFQRIAALDLREAPGLLAEIAARPTLTRQAVFAAISQLDEHNSSAVACRLNVSTVSEALRRCRARELVGQAFDTERVPMAYLRALARIGDYPLDNPDHYTRLWHMLADDGPQARAIRYCGKRLTDSIISVVEILDPVLLHPDIVRQTHSVAAAENANAVLGFLRSACTAATDEALGEAARQSGGLSALSAFALKYLQRADRFPPPPFVGTPDIRPITTAKEMKALGECMRNCAGKSSKMAEVLLGITALYVTTWRSPAGVNEPVVIELHPVKRSGTRFWIVEGVHARKRVKLPQAYVDVLLEQMGDLGALVPVDPARSAETKMLMEVLGVYRWVPIGLHDLQDENDLALAENEPAYA
jgi:hypothetical protein